MVKVRLLWPVSHIFTVVCCKFNYFQNFNSWKMLKMLKISCFELFKAKLLYLRYASRYSHAMFSSTVVKVRLLWPVSHIFTVVCCKFNYFKNFNSWKVLKMLTMGCCKQNYCISGMPQGIPMQFFDPTVVKVRLLWQVLHIFTVVCCKFNYFKISIAGKCSKCLK